MEYNIDGSMVFVSCNNTNKLGVIKMHISLI